MSALRIRVSCRRENEKSRRKSQIFVSSRKSSNFEHSVWENSKENLQTLHLKVFEISGLLLVPDNHTFIRRTFHLP